VIRPSRRSVYRLAHLIRHSSWARIAILVGAATVPSAALADDLPVLKPGVWEFKRTVEGGIGKPLTLESKKCTDPTADMKKTNSMLAGQGCKFSPVSRSGSTYSFSAQCQVQGAQYQSRSVITVDGDNAYRVEVSSSGVGPATKELLIAKRVGDCRP
jgi:hypothetical protein